MRGRPRKFPENLVRATMNRIVAREGAGAHQRRRDDSINATITFAELRRQTSLSMDEDLSHRLLHSHLRAPNLRNSISYNHVVPMSLNI